MTDFMQGFLGEDALTASVTIFALIVVWIPFVRGLKISLQAWAATAHLDRAGLQSGLRGEVDGDVEPLALLMARVFQESLRDGQGDSREFVLDASRQYAMSEFDIYYSRPIGMFASLMPPIGFIGTTIGMLILFISMHKADTTLELGALAIALTSSIFALIAYAILESVKITLYGRLVMALRVVEQLVGRRRGNSGGASSASAEEGSQASAGVPA